MIIDEGYMVPDYMKSTILKHGVKVLVCGDSGQLDPIGGQPAFLTGYNIHHLTEIMRQNLDNPIVYLAHRARYGEAINTGLYGNRALVIDEDELSNNMIANLGNIICGTNKTRDYFNQKTKDILHIDSLLPMYGERIICRENDWNREQDGIALANGLSGVVSSPKGINSFNGKTFDIDFLPDLLTDSFIDVPVNYEYMISPYDIRQQIKDNKYREGELFEFAYAKTTHLAQGAEYPSGIYYEEFLRSNIQNKLNYTGISRFRDYMIYVKKKRKFY
jgi:exodeoxyribonuclease-5